jgi:hypothetical protein
LFDWGYLKTRGYICCFGPVDLGRVLFSGAAADRKGLIADLRGAEPPKHSPRPRSLRHKRKPFKNGADHGVKCAIKTAAEQFGATPPFLLAAEPMIWRVLKARFTITLAQHMRSRNIKIKFRYLWKSHFGTDMKFRVNALSHIFADVFTCHAPLPLARIAALPRNAPGSLQCFRDCEI